MRPGLAGLSQLEEHVVICAVEQLNLLLDLFVGREDDPPSHAAASAPDLLSRVIRMV